MVNSTDGKTVFKYPHHPVLKYIMHLVFVLPIMWETKFHTHTDYGKLHGMSLTMAPVTRYPIGCTLSLCLLAYCIEHSPSWEANQFSDSQEIPCIVWNLKVHYNIYKCLPPILNLSQINPVYPPHPTSWRSILILWSHLCMGLASDLFPPGFPTKTLYTPLLSPMCATCPTHLILLNLITWTIFSEEPLC